MSETLWNDPRITAYALGELTGQERTEFEAALQQSEALAAAVEEARGITEQLRAHFAAEPVPSLDDDRRSDLFTDGGGDSPEAESGPSPAESTAAPGEHGHARRRLVVSLAVAASLLLIVTPAAWMALQTPRLAETAAGDEQAPAADVAEARHARSLDRRSNGFRNPQSGEEIKEELALDVDFDSFLEVKLAEEAETHPFPRQQTKSEGSRSRLVPAVESPAPFNAAGGRKAGTDSLSAIPATDEFFRAPGATNRPTLQRGEVAGRRAAGQNLLEWEEAEVATSSLAGIAPSQPPNPDDGLPIDEGRGPGIAGDRFDPITDNPFKRVAEHPLSTFSIDVDTASYSKVRDFLTRAGQLPRPDAVRIEELVNYFDYGYEGPGPEAEHPFAAHVELADCPWNADHRLARIALQGKRLTGEATLVTIAKDVKLQIEFNPRHVSGYRLIGYENRVLAKEDFNDDRKDAGEIGAGHSVTALYELVPAGREADATAPPVDELKYQASAEPTAAAESDEWFTLKLRYKQPEGETSKLVQFPVADPGAGFEQASESLRFAAAVAGFGMQLRRSPYAGQWTLTDVRRVAESAVGEDRFGLRREFLNLVDHASRLTGQE